MGFIRNMGYFPLTSTRDFKDEEGMGIHTILSGLNQRFRAENTSIHSLSDCYDVRQSLIDTDTAGQPIGEFNDKHVFITNGAHSVKC
jgi:hypothetical protein